VALDLRPGPSDGEPFVFNTERVRKLGHEVLSPLRASLAEGYSAGLGRQAVFEALNALALAASVVIAGTDDVPMVRTWFDSALDSALGEMREHFGEGR
jgi:hypothetical protein